MSSNDFSEKVTGDVTPFPGATSDDIQQHANDTCAVKSQQIIMHEFGLNIPEEQLAQESEIKGYYEPGQGSDPNQVGHLLNDHGIETHHMDGANVYDLVNELSQGHKVIVGVDADELWHPSFWNDWFGEDPNHALVVTGIDTTDANNVKVLVTDPGSGDVIKSYPLDEFMDAWHDSNCMMVATDTAPQPDTAPTMANFDYDAGHIPFIGNVPFDVFQNQMMPAVDSYFDGVDMDDYQDAINAYDHTYDVFSHWNQGEDFHHLLFDPSDATDPQLPTGNEGTDGTDGTDDGSMMHHNPFDIFDPNI
jgi:hypothetical protein